MIPNTAKILNGEQHEGLLDRLFRKLGYKTTGDVMSTIMSSPDSIPQAWLAPIAIASSREYERLSDAKRVEEASNHLRIARALTHYIYKNIDPNKRIIFPQHGMDENVTETGALGLIIDPDKEYTVTGDTYLVLKEVDSLRGRQAFKDSQHFQGNTEFKLEHILANVPLNDEVSYLWKEFIIGPNLNDLFRNLDFVISRGGKEEIRLFRNVEETLADISAKMVLYWQEHAPSLIDTQKDPAAVIRYYQRNFIELLRGFSKFTDLKYSDEELGNFRQSLKTLDWNFMDAKKVVRKVDATYRNMVISTRKINIDPGKFIELFTENVGRRRVNRYALEEHLYFVDTPNRYSHTLEDAWEMDLTLEGRVKKSAVEHLIRKYGEEGIYFTPEEKLLIGIFRAYRKAYLVLSRYGVKNFEKFKGGLMSERGYEENEANHHEYMNHLLRKGGELLNRMSRNIPKNQKESFGVFASALQKLGGYTKIDYQIDTSSSS